jgi:cold shock CspA family protein
MPVGRIKALTADRGFGFIKRQDGHDLFFHYSSLTVPSTELALGDTVQFDTAPGRDGRDSAVNVGWVMP